MLIFDIFLVFPRSVDCEEGRPGLVGPKNAFFHMMRLILFFLRSATSIIIFLTYSIDFLLETDILINTAVFREHVNWTN